MKTLTEVLLAAALLCLAAGGQAVARDPAVPREFQRINPCPSTGRTTGACPGWIKDHMIPLCIGGADAVFNMQWQTVEAARAKDRLERDACRRAKKVPQGD